MIPAACGWQHPHDPHIYVSGITGGRSGPIPTVTCICSGRDNDPQEGEK